MKAFNILLAICTISLYSFSGFAQASQSESVDHVLLESPISIISKYTKEAVKLRWAPKDANTWYKINQQGFELYRAEVKNKVLPNGDDYKLIDADVSPWTFSEFNEAINSGANKYVEMVGEAIHGEWESVKPSDLDIANWGNKIEELNTKYMVALFSADLDFGAAQAGAMGYIDYNIDPNLDYAYKLKLKGDTLYHSTYKVTRSKSQEKVPEVRLSESYEGEDYVQLQWKRSSHERHFTAYVIERSADGQTFSSLTEDPFVHVKTDHVDELPYIIYIDSVANYRAHYYRVIGLDAFGDRSQPSKTLRLMGKDRTPPNKPVVDSVWMNEEQTIMLMDWHLMDNARDIDKIVIKKGTAIEGPYAQIAEVESIVQHYEDKNAVANFIQYYQFCAIDTAGNEACTKGKYGSFNDIIPPAAPTGLIGSIDSVGVVSLEWDRGDEPDIFGYNIHFSNGTKRVFGQLNNRPIGLTSYTDTIDLNTLTEDIYYRINVIDQRTNVSGFSNIIRLSKPDTIPPSPAVFKRYEVGKDYVEIEYRNSGAHDLLNSFLLRRTEKAEWETIATLDIDGTIVRDSAIASNTKYQYCIKSVDDDQNETLSNTTLTILTKDEKANHDLQVELNSIEERINFEFDRSFDNLSKVVLYRSKPNAKMLSYKVFRDHEILEFPKAELVGYEYKLRCFYEDGSKSSYSNTLRVN